MLTINAQTVFLDVDTMPDIPVLRGNGNNSASATYSSKHYLCQL